MYKVYGGVQTIGFSFASEEQFSYDFHPAVQIVSGINLKYINKIYTLLCDAAACIWLSSNGSTDQGFKQVWNLLQLPV